MPGWSSSRNIAPATAASRLPIAGLGVLGLDPTLLLPLPAILIPTGADVGSVVLGVPANQSLIGAQVLAQGVVAEGANLRLTNTQAVRVIQ